MTTPDPIRTAAEALWAKCPELRPQIPCDGAVFLLRVENDEWMVRSGSRAVWVTPTGAHAHIRAAITDWLVHRFGKVDTGGDTNGLYATAGGVLIYRPTAVGALIELALFHCGVEKKPTLDDRLAALEKRVEAMEAYARPRDKRADL